jgi:FkbM family methyltransferase
LSSHGEGGVDKLVLERFFRGEQRGVFVDIGAARPDFLSMSALFRENGWKVILIEPNPFFCDLHRKAGHEVLQFACADYDADDVAFSVVDSLGQEYRDGQVSFESFSSLSVKESYRRLRPDLPVREIRVSVRRLDTLLRQHAPDVKKIDVLSIDVEGWELEVLRGLSLETYRPTVIIMENFLDDPGYSRFMSRHGYLLWTYDAPNDIYVDGAAVPAGERLHLRARTIAAVWRRSLKSTVVHLGRRLRGQQRS